MERERPPFHYDRITWLFPDWEKAIELGLQGGLEDFDRIASQLEAFSPAGVRALLAAKEFARYGKQAFVLGSNMQTMLTDTDCAHVPEKFMKLPYRCFYVATEDAALELYGDKRTGMHRLGGFYVFEPSPDVLYFFMWGMENSKSERLGDDATMWVSVDLKKVPRSTDEGGTVFLNFETYLTTLLSDPTKGVYDLGVTPPEEALRQKALENALDIIRLGLNLVLYLNSSKPEIEKDSSFRDKAVTRRKQLASDLDRVKSSSKRAKIERKAARERDGETDSMITWIARTVESRPNRPSKDSSGKKLDWCSRRGHMHHFWTGAKKASDGTRQFGTDLILKWVEPVYRDFGEIVAHDYRFRDEPSTVS